MKLQANTNKCANPKPSRNFWSWFRSQREQQVQPISPVPEPEPVLPPGAKRILVVDDDEVIRATTATKLKAHGYAVTTAADGPSAIHAARCDRPDLILLDLNFPADVSLTWDGFGIMKWLRRLDVTKNIPVIILTGSREKNLTQNARSAGAEGVFNKPVDFTPLFGMIDARLRQPASIPSPAKG